MDDAKEPSGATPILDSGVLPPTRKKKHWVGVLIGIGIGISFGAALGKVGDPPQPFLTLVFYFTILALVVAAHELGHLIAGWSVGFHFSQISLGPFTLKVEYGRLKVQLRRDLGALGFAGMHIAAIRKLRRHLMIFVAGGPAANLLSGILALTFIAYDSPTRNNNELLSFAAGLSVLSFVTAALSLIPYGSALRSDGARIWMLLRSREGTRRWIASCALASQQRMGVRPKHWKRTWLNAACSIRDGRLDELSSNLLAYVAACDRKDAKAAASHLERSLDLARWPALAQRDFVAREASYFCAWYRDDLSLAQQWLSQVKRPELTTKLLQIRTDIALDCARHKFDDSMTKCTEGTEFINALPNTSVKRLLQDSWQEWLEEVQQRQSQSMPVPL